MSFVNQRISTWFGSLSLIQWNLRASRLAALILIWRNAFWRSPRRAIGLNLVLISILHSKFWRARTFFKQLFNEKLLLFSLADASYTIRSFVLSGFSWITACAVSRTLDDQSLLLLWPFQPLLLQVVLV